MIGGRFKRDLAQLDDLFDYAISAGGPNTYEALRQIIDGTIPEGARGSIYSYAFKLIVEHFGKFLDNSEFMPWNSASFAPVNAAIAEMGVDFKLDGFLHGGDLPVKLPQPDDFPMTAWLDAAAVKKIDAAFGTATYKGADEEAGEPSPARASGSGTPRASAAGS